MALTPDETPKQQPEDEPAGHRNCLVTVALLVMVGAGVLGAWW
jgi:hypothetical protein